MTKQKVPESIGRWKIESVLGEGAFGLVYCVSDKNGKSPELFAMKVEERQKNRLDEVLRMEVRVMERVQGKFFCTILDKGQTPQITFLVMTMLGKPLDDIRRKQPDRKFSIVSSLKIGMQLMRAFNKLHSVGYIHRDVKPANIAPGYKHANMIYLFDFGLSRYIYMLEDPNKLRPARRKVSFRGTYRYCSINAHRCHDQGRVDDLWGVLYTLIELCTGRLPWTGVRQTESLGIKEEIQDNELFAECPRSFAKLKKRLSQWKFEDKPDYEMLLMYLYRDVLARGTQSLMTAPFEWQQHPEQMDPFAQEEQQAGNEQNEDNVTVGTVESEYESEYESKAGTSSMSRTVDDTMDELNDDVLNDKSKQFEEQKRQKKEKKNAVAETARKPVNNKQQKVPSDRTPKKAANDGSGGKDKHGKQPSTGAKKSTPTTTDNGKKEKQKGGGGAAAPSKNKRG